MGLESVQEKTLLPLIINLFLKPTNNSQINITVQFLWNCGGGKTS